MRALIIGFGSIGQRHARNLRALQPDIELMVVARAGAPTAVPDVMRFDDLPSALRQAPSLAIVATPSGQHWEALEQLLPAGVPTYIEKPVVATEAQAARLEALLARLAPAPLTLVGCNLRHLPSLVRLRELCRTGRLGNIVRAVLEVGQWLPDWRPGRDHRQGYSAHPEMGGGVILDLMHELDQARWLFGEFDRLHAMAGQADALEIASEAVAGILLGRAGGPVVSVNLDYVARRRIRRYCVVGDQATAEWDLGLQRLTLGTPDHLEIVECGDAAFDMSATYVSALREFLRCVRTGERSSQDIRDGLESTRLALRARQQAGL